MADFSNLDQALASIDQATSLTLQGEGELPEAIAKLVNLQKLDLERWRVSAVPSWLARLDKLEVLKLGGAFGAPPVEFPSVVLELSKLRELSLDNFHFTEIPDDIARLGNLEVLRMLGGKLTRLPSTLDQLTKLRVLSPIGHEIAGLPDCLAAVGTLEELEVGGNPLGVLPDWIGRLKRLRTLGIMNTQLRALPESIGELSELGTLQADQNQLGRLPTSIGRLTKVQHFQVQNAGLVELPREIGNLKQVRALYLGWNKLRAVPDEIGELTQLYALGLGHNELSAVPDTLANCKGLISLSLEANTFSEDEVTRLREKIVTPLKRKLKHMKWPHTATAREPTYAQRTLSAAVAKHITRLGGSIEARETPGDPKIEKLPSGERALPEAIRQWWRDVTWPPGTQLRGTIMDGWGPVTLDTPARIYVGFEEYKCAKTTPYYPLAIESDHQVHYVCSLADIDHIDDPWVYRLDGHGWDDHPLRTGKHLSQVLAKLKQVPGTEMRAMVVAVYSQTGAERVASAQELAKLTAAKLLSLRALSTLGWLLEKGAEPPDPADDVAIRLAALTGLAKLKSTAAEYLALVQKIGETHADDSVRAECAKTVKKLAKPKK